MTPQTTPRLSLFAIEAELLQLIDQREDALERHFEAKEMPVILEIEAELKVIEGLIRDYLKREVRKVDSIAFAVKEYEARAEARKAEAERMKASADRDAETAQRIKDMVLEVMREFNEKKLPGRLFTLSRQGNGGVQALTIAQPDLIPLAFQCCTVEIDAEAVEEFVQQFAGRYRIVEEIHPAMKDIRYALERGQGVMGARLEPRGEHIRIK